MSAWFSVELHVAGGLTVTSDITDEDAKTMLADEHRYIFRGTDLDDKEKVIRMAATQIALAVAKGSGIFELQSPDGRRWLVPNAQIVAAAIIQPDGQRRGIGFGQLDERTATLRSE